VPRLLWNIVPGLTLFRQWIFFLTFLNLHLLYLHFVVGRAYVEWEAKQPTDRFVAVGIIVVSTVLVILGFLSPLYGLPLPLLFLLKILPIPQIARYTRQAFYAVLFGGALVGASLYLNHLRIFLNEWQSAHFAGVFPQKTGIEAVEQLKGIYQQFVALPKGVSQESYMAVNQRGLFHFSNGENEMSPVPHSRISLVEGGVKITNDSKFHFLVLPQINDGLWYFKTDGFLPVLSTSSGTVGTIVKIPSGAREIEVIRRKSAWSFLIVLMWVPLASIGLLALWQQVRQLASFGRVANKVFQVFSQVEAAFRQLPGQTPS
jgi:hypothetical protein